jgi:hypothetical protein
MGLWEGFLKGFGFLLFNCIIFEFRRIFLFLKMLVGREDGEVFIGVFNGK